MNEQQPNPQIRTGPTGEPDSRPAHGTALVTTADTPIRALTVLPAHREDVELHTADGLTLVGELARPLAPDGRPHVPAATLVTLHPLPTHGGYMDSHVYRKASWRLPALADLAVLRFNTRGTSSPRGTSQGSFDEGVAEQFDVHAAIEYAEYHDLPRRWLVGWSFGTELALMHGRDPSIEGAILLSPPLRRASDADLDAWDAFGKPLVVLVPEHDDYLKPDEARRRFARVRQAAVIGVDGAKHLWVGEQAVRRVLDEIVAHVLPGHPPLPTRWSGPSSTAVDGADRTVAPDGTPSTQERPTTTQE